MAKRARKKTLPRKLVGCWALLLGIIIALGAAALYPEAPIVAPVLIVLGFVIGVLNLGEVDTQRFSLACVAILITAISALVTDFERLAVVLPYVALFLGTSAVNAIAVVAPALLLFSLKLVHEMRK